MQPNMLDMEKVLNDEVNWPRQWIENSRKSMIGGMRSWP